jgi:hypothetical protein
VDTEDGDTLFGLDKDLNLALRLERRGPRDAAASRRSDGITSASCPREEKAERLYAGICVTRPMRWSRSFPHSHC